MSRASMVTTSTGIHIGGAYVRPAQRMSADAEAIQRSLLDRRLERRADAAAAFVNRMLWAGLTVGLLCAWRVLA